MLRYVCATGMPFPPASSDLLISNRLVSRSSRQRTSKKKKEKEKVKLENKSDKQTISSMHAESYPATRQRQPSTVVTRNPETQ
jgi:hypothetical protein